MTPSSATALFHVLGFLTATALYVMLAAMTLGARPDGRERGIGAGGGPTSFRSARPCSGWCGTWGSSSCTASM